MKWIAPLVIIALMLAAYFLGLFDTFTFENLQQHHLALKERVAAHPISSPLLYIAIYTVITALSIPGAIFVTVTGGFLFPMPLSVVYTVLGATIGSTALFIAAKTSIGDFLRRRTGKVMVKMEKGFHDGEIGYLFFLRLVPLFPFWLINLAPAFFGVRLWTFVWTTFLGIIPGSYVYCQAGRGLDALLASGEHLSIATVFNRQIITALVLLALFAILPVVIKKLRGRGTS